MRALRIILLILAFIAQPAHAGLFDELGTALGGGAKSAKPDTAKPETAKPDTTQTPENAPDKAARNLAVKETGNAAKRVALVIGNDRYSSVPQLKNAVADARSMAAELKRAGFDVTLKTDADLDAMKLAVRQFKASLSGGDEAVFFYSGHGVQLGAANYLLPVNITSDNEEQVKDDAIPLQRLLDDLQDQKVKFALAIIDACRDNPFKAAGKRSIGGTRGLAPTSAANGQMVIFSAGNGQQALDKLGDTDRDKNGVFTRVFLQEMQKPGLEVHQVVQGVRRRVDEMAKSVKHDQVPAMYDQVVGDFHFYPGIGQGTQVASLIPVPARVKTKEEIEDDYWDDIKDSNDLASYEQYSKAYPEGRYLNPANHKIAQLKKKIQDAAPAKPAEPIPAPAPTPAARVKKSDEEIEDAAWESVRNSGNIGAIQEYLKEYPKGQYAAPARILITSLKPAPAKPAEPVAPPIRGDNESALWSEAQKGNSKDDYDAYLAQYPKGKYMALAKSRIKKLQDEAAAEAARKEQEAWEAAGKSESEDGYQSYLNGWPSGKYAGLAQVRLRKLQTDLAAARQKKLEEDAIQQAKQEREAAARQEAERQRQQAEAAQEQQRQAALAARQERELWQKAEADEKGQILLAYLDKYPSGSHASAAEDKLAAIKKAEAEMKPGKVFKDCPDCPEMVILPAGSFNPGQASGKGGRGAIVVAISAAVTAAVPTFAMGKYEVTQGQWKALMGNNPSKFSNCGDTCPVERVSWNVVQEFIQKLNSKTGKQYRLPTEAEWEYACYGGSQSEYCGGGNIDSVAWYDDNSGKTTHPAGQKQANGYGLYDMSGNVWEWMENKYDNEHDWRVLRGGSWNDDSSGARAAARRYNSPGERAGFMGFRVARTLP